MTTQYQPTHLEILTIGDSRLPLVCRQLTMLEILAPATHKFIDDLIATTVKHNLIGISAPQVGLPWRIMVVFIHSTRFRPGLQEKPPLVLISPDITSCLELDTDWEGCGSVPNIFGEVKRPSTIEVTYLDRTGEKHTQEFTGLEARVIQHEDDHFRGDHFLKFADLSTLMMGKHFKKMMRAQLQSARRDHIKTKRKNPKRK